MRKLIFILLAVWSLQACQTGSSEEYTLKVDLEGSEGKWVKLLARVDGQYVSMDSIQVMEGEESILTGTIDGVKTMYLTVEDMQGSIRLLMENSHYEISGSLEDPEIKTESKAQKDLNAYQAKVRVIDEQMADLTEIYYATDPADTERMDSIRQVAGELNGKQQQLDSSYVADHPASYASVLVLRGSFYTLDTDGLDAALSQLDPSLHQMEEYQFMAEKLERLKAVAIGQEFTDFGLATPDGEILKVSDVHQGKVLMIDFWASWCGPCRSANPGVVAIYQDYKEQGFEILGVSLDRDEASWKKAIEDDQLDWHHISDLKFWDSEGAELYGVSSIPHTVLINREGKIFAKNLHGDELREAIESLL